MGMSYKNKRANIARFWLTSVLLCIATIGFHSTAFLLMLLNAVASSARCLGHGGDNNPLDEKNNYMYLPVFLLQSLQYFILDVQKLAVFSYQRYLQHLCIPNWILKSNW